MIDDFSKKEIEKISIELLRHSKSLDIFPTPISKIISYSELVVNERIDLSKVKTSFFQRSTESLFSAIKKVRGFLDRRKSTIYLDYSQSASRLAFVKLHEVGHHVLTWQAKTMEFMDDDETLDIHTKEQFEAEASFFASATLFQNDRFKSELDKLPLSIDSAKFLSKHFGSSIHAALRRLVEVSTNRCALLVLEKNSGNNYFIRDKFHSEKFRNEFGELMIPEILDNTLPFMKDCYSNRRYKKDGLMSVVTIDGDISFTYHFFNNTYNAFVFLFPVGEKKRSGVNFVVSVPA